MSLKILKENELPVNSLKEYLIKHQLLSSKKAKLQIKRFSKGYSNLTYLLETETNKLVLRCPPQGAVRRGHDMQREFRVLTALRSCFKTVPHVYLYAEKDEVLPVPFYLMEFIDGEIPDYTWVMKAKPEPEVFGKITNAWLDTMVRLHELDIEANQLQHLGKPENYVERQLKNWGKQFAAAATQEVPVADKVCNWMDIHQPKKYEHSVIHNDFKYDNVVFAHNNWGEIKAVLDWEMATLGDPLMDLGTSLGYWTTIEDHSFIKELIPSPTVMPGNPSRSQLVALYVKKSGRKVDDLIFYYAFGLFKIAVIAQQIFFRYKKGLTTDKRFSQLDKAAVLLCKMAWQTIQKKDIDTFESA